MSDDWLVAQPGIKRRRILISPKLQLRLIGPFLGVSAIALFLQFGFMASLLLRLSRLMPGDSRVAGEVQTTAWTVLGLSFLVVMPLTLLIGVLTTFRIAGPVYRMERHLEALARGEDPGPCRIRKKDALQGLCDRLNAAVTTLRGESDPAAEPESDSKAA